MAAEATSSAVAKRVRCILQTCLALVGELGVPALMEHVARAQGVARMPWAAKSLAIERVRAFRAPFDAT